MNNKKLIGIAMIVVLGGIAVWYFFLRGKASEIALATSPGLGAADTQCYNALLALFKSEANSGALSWMLPYVAKNLAAGPSSVHPDYLTYDGKLGKAGSFMAVYAAAYYGPDKKDATSEKKEYGYPFSGKTLKDGQAYYDARKSLNDRLYQIFIDYKTQYLVAQTGL